MSVEYTKKTWYDGSEGGTPITAAELNRVETGIDDVVTQSNADKTNIDNHMASKVNSSSGAHGFRYYSDKLDYYDETNEQWVEIQTGADDYEDLTNLPSINGVELLGNKVIGTLSGDIHVDSDKIGYNNTVSGLLATNVKEAIDEVLTKETTVTTDSYGYVITDPKNTHVTIPPASLSGTASMAVKSGTQGKQYTMADSENHVSADFYTKSAVDELVSGGGGTGNYPDLTNKPSINGVELLGNKLVGLLSTDIHINADKIGYSGTVSGASTTEAAIDALQSSLSGLHSVPSGGNTNQVLAKNSNSDYDLKWVNQTGGGSGFKIIVTASTYPNKSVTVTESDSGDTVTETTDANGVATFTVSAGTWTATTLVGGATVTLGSVTVGTTSIEYSDVEFAFHYSENDSSPNSVTYPSGYNNSNWDSDTAYMDFTNNTFHYGNWDPSGANAGELSWLFPKPCMLKSDGTVDYYLDPNNYTKKADGTASDIANTSYDGNAMMEWGQNGAKIYWKIIPDNDNKGFTFCVANSKLDEDYDCWNHYDCDNNIKDHFYTPIYFGSLVSNKLRSLSGQSNSSGKTRQQEIDYAKANNPDAKVHWYTEVYADWLLQGMLTCLITKSMDSQSKIGKGRTDSNNSSAINTGTMNTKGLFWGSTNGTDGVKAWGMENPWGNLQRATAGLINNFGAVKTKLTYGTADGTSASAYNLDGTGYTSSGNLTGSTGYTSHMNVSVNGIVPVNANGSSSTYYCDGCIIDNTQVSYGLTGGGYNADANAGVFFVFFYGPVSYVGAHIGATLSYK